MSQHHKIKEEKINVKCNNITLERVPEWKLLGITLGKHLQRDKNISKSLKAFYSERVETYTPLSVRKQLTESLIFSSLDYCNNLFVDLPLNQIKRLLKLQKACTGFVLNKYATCEDITKVKMATSTRENIFYHHKNYFQSSVKRKRTWKSRDTNKEFK